MERMGRLLLAAALMTLVASGAWSAVTISWTDALGPHTQNLANVDNPMAAPDPLNLEDPYVWYGVCNIAMSQAPIQFTVTGNFVGELGEIWPQVRIAQHVTNLTGKPWSEFYINIANEDGEVYTKALIEQNWSFSNDLLWAKFTADAPAYYLQPNDVFDDTMHFYAMVDPGTGDGTLTFTKHPTMVPEVGGLAILLSGGLGLLPRVIRKRRA